MKRSSPTDALVVLALGAAAALAFVACGGSDNSSGQTLPESKGGASGSDAGTAGGHTGSSAGGVSNSAGGTTGGGAGGTPGSGGASGSAGGTTSDGSGGKGGGVACGKSACGAGDYCCDALCGTCAPMGAACVQGCAVDAGPACAADSDCRVTADYCTGCDCRALATGESLPTCNGPGVQCLLDPCQSMKAACVGGTCVAVAK